MYILLVDVLIKKLVWEEIRTLIWSFFSPWIIGGDFNSISNRNERSNYKGILTRLKAFNDFIEDCKVVDLLLTRKKFMWLVQITK